MSLSLSCDTTKWPQKAKKKKELNSPNDRKSIKWILESRDVIKFMGNSFRFQNEKINWGSFAHRQFLPHTQTGGGRKFNFDFKSTFEELFAPHMTSQLPRIVCRLNAFYPFNSLHNRRHTFNFLFQANSFLCQIIISHLYSLPRFLPPESNMTLWRRKKKRQNKWFSVCLSRFCCLWKSMMKENWVAVPPLCHFSLIRRYLFCFYLVKSFSTKSPPSIRAKSCKAPTSFLSSLQFTSAETKIFHSSILSIMLYDDFHFHPLPCIESTQLNTFSSSLNIKARCCLFLNISRTHVKLN